MQKEKILFKTSHYIVKLLETKDDEIVLVRKYYPLTYAGNYQKDEIVLTKNNIKVYERWDGWARYGILTGSTTSANVEISQKQYEELRNLILNIKNIEDFDKLIDKVVEIQNEYEEKINNAINNLINEIQNLDFVQQKLSMLKDDEMKKEFIERLKLDIDEYFNPTP